MLRELLRRAHPHYLSVIGSTTGPRSRALLLLPGVLVGAAAFGFLGSDECAESASESSSIVLDQKMHHVLRKGSKMKPMSRFKTPHDCSVQNKFVIGCNEMSFFSGNANESLAEEIAASVGHKLGKAKVGKFADGEVNVKIDESVRGKDVYIVQPTSPPVNEHLMELLLMISALRHASAKRVTVIVPYFGYMRSLTAPGPSKSQTDWNYARSNLAAADIAKMMEVAGAERIVAIDMYPSGQGLAEGFFSNTPIESLESAEMIISSLAEEIDFQNKEKHPNGFVVVSPHASCFTKAKIFKDELSQLTNSHIGLATIIRTPPPPGVEGETSIDLVGNVKGKSVFLVEDIIESGRTTCAAVEAVRAAGAKYVAVFASHVLLSEGATERLAAADCEKLFCLNTIKISSEQQNELQKLHQISVAPMVANLVSKMHFEPKE